MDFYKEAAERLHKELPTVKGQKENAVKHAVQEALLNFARQDEEFAQAIAQGGSFADCMAAVCKGIGTSISDLEAYRRAAAFYFPGSDVRFEMRIELAPEAGDTVGADPQISPENDGSIRGQGESALCAERGRPGPSTPTEKPGAKRGPVIDLADFL